MSNESYFIPMTLKDIEDFIHKTIKNNPDIDGTELVVGGKYIYADDAEVPQGSILLTLKKPTLDTDDDELFGTLVMMPRKTQNLQ